jgi:leader peptidase (prepilin peptidase) / N-methyltransferase
VIVSDLPVWVIRAAAFVFGALWGSFFNVAIYRWPRDMSVVTPPSHCPHCKTPVPAWRNVPLLGYLLLRGRAGCCGERLSPRYFLVELSAAVLCVALAERYVLGVGPSAPLAGATLTTLLFFAFVGGLLVATFVDLEWLEIPDEVSIGGTALGLATVTFREPGPDAVDVAIGAGGGFLLVQLLLVWSWERLTGRRGMGEGDSKLLMFVGAFLGWKGALFALVAGAMQGLVVSVIALITGRRLGPQGEDPDDEEDAADQEDDDRWVAPAPLELRDGTKAELSERAHKLQVHDGRARLLWEYVIDPEEQRMLRRAVPFGPFIALGALEFLFFGEQLVELYLSLFE